MSEPNFFATIILEEIRGKNMAIHAYDQLMWKVRTGFLTLFFAGWGILLKALVEGGTNARDASNNRILLVMLLVSVVLGIGGLVVDMGYAKRKFRVIHALDELMSHLAKVRGQVENEGSFDAFLKVAGDKNDHSYRDVTGYHQESVASWTIYLLPMAASALAVPLLWR